MVMDFARKLLETTRGGLIAGVGVFLLFWTVTRVLGNIENSFNYIWGIKKQRSWTRKISDYLSAIIICPVLWIVSSTATVMIRTQVTFVVEKGQLVESIGPAIFFTLSLLPYCVIWILFVFIYVFMPNTRVNLKSAIFAGIIAGTFYQLFQRVYLWSQIGVAKYNAIYGSFAALPLFLVWLQLSWMIVLLGAELSFAHQNEKSYEFEPDCSRVSVAFKRLLTLQVMHLLVKEFAKGSSALSAEQISTRLQIPIILVRKMVDELMASGLVSELCVTARETRYQPSKDIDLLTIKYVIDCLEEMGSHDVPVVESEELSRISECLKAFDEAVQKSPKNILLREI
jgi:membrane protein